MSFAEWRARVEQIIAERETPQLRAELLQNQLEFALARLWRAMQTPPREIRSAYEDLQAEPLAAAASRRAAELSGEARAAWAPDLSSAQSAAMAVAVEVRALDQALFESRDATRADEPNEEYLAHRDESVFILPRPSGASAPEGRRGQNFERRGLRFHRILPVKVDDLTVRLYTPAIRGPGADGSSADLVSAMFAEVRPDLLLNEDEGFFRFVGIKNEAALREALDAQISLLLSGEACLGAVWPELTISPALLNVISSALRAKALDEDAPELGFVMAGSWHHPHDAGFVNTAPVLDGHGRRLLDVVKRERFQLKPGVIEQIRPGSEVPVLVYGEVLIAFGICKDFCERRAETPYQRLDVDFVVVPSFGAQRTMDEHVVAADTLGVRYGARSFVVQQLLYDEDRAENDAAPAASWGVVLRPAGRPRGAASPPSAQNNLLERARVSCTYS